MQNYFERIRDEKNLLSKKLLFLSWLNQELETRFKTKTVLVGGTAVELYSGAAFQSVDIDVIYGSSADIDSILLSEGFIKSGRYWQSVDLDILLEAPASVLAGSQNLITCVTFDSGKVYVIGIEDLILDRLRAACYWKDTVSLDQTAFLIQKNKNSIQFDYLKHEIENEPDLSRFVQLNSKKVSI